MVKKRTHRFKLVCKRQGTERICGMFMTSHNQERWVKIGTLVLGEDEWEDFKLSIPGVAIEPFME